MKLELDTDNEVQMRMVAGYLLGNLKSARVISLLSTEDRVTPFALALQEALTEMGSMRITYGQLAPVSFAETLHQKSQMFKESISRAFRTKPIRPRTHR
jgi:hypothetical protein